MSELTRRIIFAVIAAPASIAIVYLGDWALAIVLSVLAALSAWELFRMARETGAFSVSRTIAPGLGRAGADVSRAVCAVSAPENREQIAIDVTKLFTFGVFRLSFTEANV